VSEESDQTARGGTAPRAVVAGAGGFVGSALVADLAAQGFDILTVGRGESRDSHVSWGDTAGLDAAVDGADLVVNLAGKNVSCRYSPRNRREILNSRTATTAALARAISRAATPPPLWINASTATIYRHAMDRPMTESTGEIGEGFSVGVATAWEHAFFSPDLPDTRRVALRMAIVLGHGSALAPLLGLARVGLGGRQFDGRWWAPREKRAAGAFHEFQPTRGRQMFSWVHLDDVLGIVSLVIEDDSIDGAVNVCAPNPVDNGALMATVRRAVRMPVGVPLRRWMIELGALGMRTESELLLKSRWVVPERLTALGYEFRHPELGGAIDAVVHPSR
jgi:NAD dependent epimerase/dehydratase family enzyme